jgi:hypothetical protein
MPAYRVRCAPSREAFRLFVLALERRDVAVTPEVRADLAALSAEFEFAALAAQLAAPEIPLDRRCPVDALIVDFLHCAWNALPDVAPFYAAAAVFSLSVALHGPDSPLEAFERFSHYAGDDRAGNVLRGKEEIGRGLVEVFGTAMMSRPTAMAVGTLGGSVVAIGLHGTVWAGGQWLAFDRALVAGFVSTENRMLITNDHLYLREDGL